jgi:hypothetical protein
MCGRCARAQWRRGVGATAEQLACAQDVQLLARFEEAFDVQLDLHVELLPRITRHAPEHQNVPVRT